MKCLLTLIICMGAAWPMSSYAQFEDSHRYEQWEVRESELETYEIKTEGPSTDTLLADEEIVTKKGQKFVLHGEAIDKVSLQRLRDLSPEKQANFHQIRRTILTRFAAVLNSQRLTIGAAVVTVGKIVSLFKKKNITEAAEVQEPQQKPTLRELGAVSIETILNNMNKKFWSEAANVGGAKEVTLYINPMGHVILALPKIKAGGAIGFAFGIGYVKETDVLFLDVLANVEKVKSGFATLVAAKVNIALDFNSNETRTPLFKVQKGEIVYPMLVPFWEGTGKGVYTVGFSFTASLPPTPFTDAFQYRTDSKRIRVLRLGINTLPMWTLVYNSLQRIRAPEKVVLRYQEKARLGIFANSCPRIF
jgi:hypothetical protein